MKIQENVSLKPYNTFGIDAKARFFVHVTSEEELVWVLEQKKYPEKLILGGGSNMLLTGDIDALVIHIGMMGKEVLEEDGKHTLIRIMAGENWHDLVLWTLERNLGGLENLSLIPGSVGSAPIQNIGAYGVELKDSFVNCEAVEVATGEKHVFSLEDCRFGYRESFFKQEGKGKFVITSVTLKLTSGEHQLRTEYGTIADELKEAGVLHPSITDISNAVIRIRQRKLPDPAVLGNSGSFFKNPVVDKGKLEEIQQKYEHVPFYSMSEKEVKIPAAWLIDTCGFKGMRLGDAGVHQHQALVLVNYGNASGGEILNLATKIQKEVRDTFGISIEPEVNIL
ncbi:UDP-N-acetylmuramate dehydrogenase [Muriicola marianensis]|uniref:UDP-N-acetylenolpyruvoylglucosamine reductase n=1 Tax=Muriicola marianensis TaxID=1324801 RepID=A0ABQ1QSW4_9FLAO|nr:UDP-N-acetylmuramate dehydrogenase [Muriicola marianensis]GGD44479.1 UDP-N-acetylenolpyruvoylglucosamine reductase [Muriicola marianensis]